MEGDRLLRHLDGFVPRLSLGKAAWQSGNEDRVPAFFLRHQDDTIFRHLHQPTKLISVYSQYSHYRQQHRWFQRSTVARNSQAAWSLRMAEHCMAATLTIDLPAQ